MNLMFHEWLPDDEMHFILKWIVSSVNDFFVIFILKWILIFHEWLSDGEEHFIEMNWKFVSSLLFKMPWGSRHSVVVNNNSYVMLWTGTCFIIFLLMCNEWMNEWMNECHHCVYHCISLLSSLCVSVDKLLPSLCVSLHKLIFGCFGIFWVILGMGNFLVLSGISINWPV